MFVIRGRKERSETAALIKLHSSENSTNVVDGGMVCDDDFQQQHGHITPLPGPPPPHHPASPSPSPSPSRPVKKRKKKRLCFEGDVRGNRRTLSYFDVQRGDQTRRILHGHCTSFVPSEGSWVCFPNHPSTRVAKHVLHRPWKQSVDIILMLLAGSEAWKSFVIISHFGSSAFSTLPATPVIFWPDSQLTIYLLTKARVVLVSSSCTFFFYRAFWF